MLTGGTVLNPATKTKEKLDVGVKGDRVTAIQASIPRTGVKRVIDVTGCYVTPGLIDFHVHSYWGVNPYGCDLDALCLATGVTSGARCRIGGAGESAGISQTRLREIEDAHDRFRRVSPAWRVERTGGAA